MSAVLDPDLPRATRALHAAYEDTWRTLSRVMPEAEWWSVLPLIAAIDDWKHHSNAVILAHNYQTPAIFHGVADFQGDSLALARHAQECDAEVIVMCGVHFMAETVKLLCPDKLVLLPSLEAGCSLAAALTAEDVRTLRRQHPGVPVVCYVNTSAAVKAECDLCCTSANAVETVRSLGVPKVIFVPDRHLADYVAMRTGVEVITWSGECEVHVRFSRAEIEDYRTSTGAYVLAHPECPRGVLQAADFVGSTSAMITELARRQPQRALLVTECAMADNVSAAHPQIEFVRPCNLCPHMKQITLPRILQCLQELAPAIDVPPEIAERARRTVQRMLR